MTRKALYAIALLAAVVALRGSVARADDEAPDSDEPEATDAGSGAAPSGEVAAADAAALAQAKEVLTAYLDAVKAKKYDNARKYIHPQALADMAAIKKRTGGENHGLATWARKDGYLTNYALGAPEASAKGSVAIPSTEEEFDVEAQGTQPDVKAEYLLIPLNGKWYVADRRSGEGELFPARTAGLSYKGYFQGEYVAPPPEVLPAKATKKARKKKKHS